MEEIPTWDWGDTEKRDDADPEPPPVWMSVMFGAFWVAVVIVLFVLFIIGVVNMNPPTTPCQYRIWPTA